jgi:hypothetical protein
VFFGAFLDQGLEVQLERIPAGSTAKTGAESFAAYLRSNPGNTQTRAL